MRVPRLQVHVAAAQPAAAAFRVDVVAPVAQAHPRQGHVAWSDGLPPDREVDEVERARPDRPEHVVPLVEHADSPREGSGFLSGSPGRQIARNGGDPACSCERPASAHVLGGARRSCSPREHAPRELAERHARRSARHGHPVGEQAAAVRQAIDAELPADVSEPAFVEVGSGRRDSRMPGRQAKMEALVGRSELVEDAAEHHAGAELHGEAGPPSPEDLELAAAPPRCAARRWTSGQGALLRAPSEPVLERPAGAAAARLPARGARAATRLPHPRSTPASSRA